MPRLDELDDEAQEWTAETEHAIAILESLDASRWESLRELARSHVTGRLSYEGWRAAVGDIIESAARRR